MMDISLTEDAGNPGCFLAHKPDCYVVMQHRLERRPVATMFRCEKPLPDDLKKCACLE